MFKLIRPFSFKALQNIDDYAKDGGSEAALVVCSSHQDPLRTQIVIAGNNFAVWSPVSLRSNLEACKSHLNRFCEYERHT